MAEGSKIEWTDHTFNPWTGCTKITPGCDHCYAEAWSKRSGHVRWGNHERKRTTEAYWRSPLVWQKRAAEFAAAHGRRQRVFCASLADVFDNQAEADWRRDLFTLIKATPALDWLLLTKRPQNIAKMLPPDWGAGYINVWLGTTAEDQQRYDERWKHLFKVPAVIRFVSYEPAIGPLRLHRSPEQPDWVIVGGESGHGSRPMDAAWVSDVILDCKENGVAPFFKQWGAFSNNPLSASFGGRTLASIDPNGKGGGLLNGRIIREFPRARIAVDEAIAAA